VWPSGLLRRYTASLSKWVPDVSKVPVVLIFGSTGFTYPAAQCQTPQGLPSIIPLWTRQNPYGFIWLRIMCQWCGAYNLQIPWVTVKVLRLFKEGCAALSWGSCGLLWCKPKYMQMALTALLQHQGSRQLQETPVNRLHSYPRRTQEAAGC
jgi:hypothetical protein